MDVAYLPSLSTYGRAVALRDFGGFALSLGLHAPGEVVPAHRHEDEYQWCLALEGGFEETSGAREEHCGAGSFLVRPPDCVHSDRFSRLRGMCLNFFPRAEWLKANGYDAIADTYAHQRSRRLLSLGRELAAELCATAGSPAFAAESLVHEVLSVALRYGDLRREGCPAWLAAAVEQIETDPSSSLGVVAKAAGVSAGHLARAFRARFGRSVGGYARGQRLSRAAARLREGGAALVDIAVDAGFYDQAHFTRAFKAQFGMTPAAYRREN